MGYHLVWKPEVGEYVTCTRVGVCAEDHHKEFLETALLKVREVGNGVNDHSVSLTLGNHKYIRSSIYEVKEAVGTPEELEAKYKADSRAFNAIKKAEDKERILERIEYFKQRLVETKTEYATRFPNGPVLPTVSV